MGYAVMGAPRVGDNASAAISMLDLHVANAPPPPEQRRPDRDIRGIDPFGSLQK